MRIVKVFIAIVLITPLIHARTLTDLAAPPDLAEECQYHWSAEPGLIDPVSDSTIADSTLLEWLGPDSPVSRNVLDSLLTFSYSGPDNSTLLSLLILPFKKGENALVLYEYLTQSRWLADRVELHGSVVYLARQAPDTRDVCIRLLCNEISDRVFEREAETTYDRARAQELDGVVQNVLGQFWGRAARRDGTRILPDDDLEAHMPLIPAHDALRILGIGNLSGNARRCGLEWEDTFLAFMKTERGRFWDEKQIAFLGLLHGIGQRMTLNSPGECGKEEGEDVERSLRQLRAKLESSRGRRVWSR